MNCPDKCLPVSMRQPRFLSMLRTIRNHAATAFRQMNSEAREQTIQEAIVNAAVVYARLVELKKVELAYPTVLARYAVARIKGGRRSSSHASTNATEYGSTTRPS